MKLLINILFSFIFILLENKNIDYKKNKKNIKIFINGLFDLENNCKSGSFEEYSKKETLMKFYRNNLICLKQFILYKINPYLYNEYEECFLLYVIEDDKEEAFLIRKILDNDGLFKDIFKIKKEIKKIEKEIETIEIEKKNEKKNFFYNKKNSTKDLIKNILKKQLYNNVYNIYNEYLNSLKIQFEEKINIIAKELTFKEEKNKKCIKFLKNFKLPINKKIYKKITEENKNKYIQCVLAIEKEYNLLKKTN